MIWNIVLRARKCFINLLCVILFPMRETRHKMRGIWLRNSLPQIIAKKSAYLWGGGKRKKFPYYLSLTLCIKDEGAYILEWIEYHLLQGVEHFYIYNNNGTDNTRELLDDYIRRGIVTWHEYPGPNKQEEIYNHAVRHYKNQTRWMGFIDADEFIVPMQHKTVAAAMRDYEYASQLHIQWIIYGSSGHVHKTPGLVIERFTKHAATVDCMLKSIVNPRAVWYARVHTHSVIGKTVCEDHTETSYAEHKTKNPTANILRINHYIIKSWDEFLHKRYRGYPTKEVINGDGYFYKFDRNDIDAGDLMKPYADIINRKLGNTPQ